MTREEMIAKLTRPDLSGVGVKVCYTNGHQNHFFYEDYGPETGVARAVRHMLNEIRRGTIQSFSFIEYQNGTEIEKEPVGTIEYGYGDSQTFYDKDEYIKMFKEALNMYGVSGGIKATTFTRDPETRKAYDDALWNEFGEENPHGIEHYREKYAQGSRIPAEKAQHQRMAVLERMNREQNINNEFTNISEEKLNEAIQKEQESEFDEEQEL